MVGGKVGRLVRGWRGLVGRMGGEKGRKMDRERGTYRGMGIMESFEIIRLLMLGHICLSHMGSFH